MRQSTTLSLRGAKRRGNPAALFNMPLADAFLIRWIATACGLAMTAHMGRSAANEGEKFHV